MGLRGELVACLSIVVVFAIALVGTNYKPVALTPTRAVALLGVGAVVVAVVVIWASTSR